MKYIYKSIATVLFTGLFTGKAQAQQPQLEKSLLWEISGNGLNKPSYIYGTTHMICEADFIIKDKVKHAFEKSKQLVIEANIQDPNMNEILAKAMATDVPQSRQLSPADYNMVDSILQLKCGIPFKLLDNYKLSAVLALMAQKSFPCAATKSYELTFLEMAKNNKIAVTALEGLAEQAEYLNKSFTDQQILSQVKDFDDGKKEGEELITLYKAEDLMGMYNNMTAPKLMDENSIHWMLEVRNNNWVNKMPELMKAESSFFAVGAAHLAGPIGVIKLLRTKGYTVKPILN